MKQFRTAAYDQPPRWIESEDDLTMTVGEIIDKLKEYDLDMPVFATWEGICVGIKQDLFLSEPFHNKKCHPDDKIDCLYINVNNY